MTGTNKKSPRNFVDLTLLAVRTGAYALSQYGCKYKSLERGNQKGGRFRVFSFDYLHRNHYFVFRYRNRYFNYYLFKVFFLIHWNSYPYPVSFY